MTRKGKAPAWLQDAPAHECRPEGVFAPMRSKFEVQSSRFNVRLFRLFWCLVFGVWCLLPVSAATSENPYAGIVERNVFALKPPPPPPDPESLKPLASKITLTGILTIFGKKQALMKTPPGPAVPPKPGQPPEPPKEHSYMLTEGQREDEITVLQIDELAKTVKVDNSGHIETLTFATNAPSAAAAAYSGAPSPTGNATPPPGGFRSIPRPLRIPTMGSALPYTGGAANPGAAEAPTAGPGGVPYAGATAQPAIDQPSAASQRPIEENVALYELNRVKNEKLNQSGVRRPLLPRHPLMQGMDEDPSQSQIPVQPRTPFVPPGRPFPQ